MQHSRSNQAVLLAILLATSAYTGASESYLGYQASSLSFIDMNPTDAIVYEDSLYQAIDFTLALGDNYVIGLAMDLDQEQERTRKLLVKLGFGDWGAIIESGKVAGHFGYDSDLAFQPGTGKFEQDYEGFKIYARNGWNSKHGFTYAHWKQPSMVEASLDWDDSYGDDIAWIDPEVEYTFYGWFMTNNTMELLTKGYDSEKGLNFEAVTEIGYLQIDTSGTGISRANRLVDKNIRQEAAAGIASRSNFYVGFYGGDTFNDQYGWAWGVGYQLGLHGIMLGGRSYVDEEYLATPSQHVISHGFYGKVMVRM